jgi:rRNA processing protein Krr1/Pno1
MESEKIKKIKVDMFKTNDGELHKTLDEAIKWQFQIDLSGRYVQFIDHLKRNDNLTSKKAEDLLDILCRNSDEFVKIFLIKS